MRAILLLGEFRGDDLLRIGVRNDLVPGIRDRFDGVGNALGEYFRAARLGAPDTRDIHAILENAQQVLTQSDHPPPLAAVLRAAPNLKNECRALLVLSQLGEAAVTEIMARTTAEGSLLRRKLEPVTAPIRHELDILLAP